MRWRRQRREAVGSTAVVAAAPGMGVELMERERTERAMAALAVHAAQLDERLARIERRLDEQEDVQLDLPNHTDVLEVRLHSARVAAEVARLAVELRALGDAVERAPGAEPTTPRQQRLATLAEQIIELSDAFDTAPADTIADGSSGWDRRTA